MKLACAALEHCRHIRERLHALLRLDERQRPEGEKAERLYYAGRAHRPYLRTMPRVASPGAHRLSVVDEGVEPCLRCELVVASDATLDELHAILQVAKRKRAHGG